MRADMALVGYLPGQPHGTTRDTFRIFVLKVTYMLAHRYSDSPKSSQVKSGQVYTPQNAKSTRPVKCARAPMALIGMCSSRPKSSWAEEPIMSVSLCWCSREHSSVLPSSGESAQNPHLNTLPLWLQRLYSGLRNALDLRGWLRERRSHRPSGFNC